MLPNASRIATVIALGLLVSAVGVNSADAQQFQDRHFRPANPTMSPYMGLLQTNVGPVPNYFSLVRPMLQQRAFNQQMQRTTATQSLQIQSLSTQAPQQLPTPQTGKGAGFQQFLHFFPSMQPPRRR